jgi:Ca2+-binding RTX toxin-like protein
MTVNTGADEDTINVGSLAPDTGGTVNGIRAPLTINGEGGIDTLNVDDTGDALDTSGVLTATTLTGLGMSNGGITYVALEHLNIGLGVGDDIFTIAGTRAGETTLTTNAGSDTVNVLGTHAAATINTGDDKDTVNIRNIGAAMTVNTGDDDDTVNVGNLAPETGGTVNGISAALTVNAGQGDDTLNLDNTGDALDNSGVILTATTITGLGMSDEGVTYESVEHLNLGLGSGGNTINIQKISVATTLNTGAGDDTINVGSLAPGAGGTVNAINALLTLNGQAGFDILNVDDSGDTGSNAGILTGNTIIGLGMEDGIVYGGMEQLEISLGSGDDDFEVQGTMNREDGFRTVTMVNTGAGDDRLIFGDGINVNGSADGGAGVDTLDFSAWTTGVNVNLKTGSATAVGGGAAGRVIHFENVTGGAGNDTLIGDDHDNHLVGGSGNDTLIGLGGNDILDGGYGSDLMDGGVGDDTYIEVPGGFDRIVDAAGVDLIDFSGAGSGIKIDLRLYKGQKQKVDATRNQLSTKGIIENVIGSSFDDVIKGNKLRNLIWGGAGADKIIGRRGDDELHGQSGNDLIFGSRGDDTLYGGEGDDKIFGGRNNDHIEGGSGSDLLYGSRGKDALYGGDGDDKLYGGKGTDRIEGGLGNDLVYGGRGIDALYGGEGDDKIYGGKGADRIEGGLGNDHIDGGRGQDALYGEDGNDKIYGGSGKDHIEGGPGNDHIDGGGKKDALYGGDGDDTLVDDSGKDLLDGGAGNDTLPSWVKSFVTDLAETGRKEDPNEKIKITLPE